MAYGVVAALGPATEKHKGQKYGEREYKLRLGVKRPDWLVVEAMHVPMLIKLMKDFRALCVETAEKDN